MAVAVKGQANRADIAVVSSATASASATGQASDFSSALVASALTGVAFIGLYWFGLLGDLPLGLLLGLLVGAAGVSELVGRRWGQEPTTGQLHALLATQVLTTTVIIYAIGWGPTLAIGFVFVLARDIEQIGARVWRPALGWILVGLAGGQLAIVAGWVPTYVKEPYVHGLALLMALGVAFVVHLLGQKRLGQEEAAVELRASATSFRQLFADNPQPMWVYHAESLRFMEVNEAAIGHYGYSRAEFFAQRITDIRPAEDVDALTVQVRTRTPGAHHREARHRLKDGRLIDVEVNSHEFVFDHQPAVLVAVQDVTRRNALEAELRHQAFHDSLTNLANRALFADRIEHAIQRASRDTTTVAVLVADLDGFKTVNDSLGHTAGDALLVAVAQRLQSALRPSDTAARLGGDEFGILLEDLDEPNEASDVAQRLIDALAAPFCLSGKELFVHASIGIALRERNEEDGGELLRNADAAMYGAKSEGKGRYRLYEPDMHSAAVARLELEADLRRAIDGNEFVLHYQPVASLSTGNVASLEALVRWQHPDRGLIPPDEFIPLAEENGLIIDIGRWVLREACRQARLWQNTFPDVPFTIAVNVSARQLADPGLVHDVSRVLAATGLDPANLTLEITETVLIAEPQAAIARLRQLKATGVQLAIDDFGTGYSSLSSLRTLPVDSLKIDKAFIDGVTTGTEAEGLVQAILRLAGTFHLVTTAEGVEHRDQLERLEQLGCQQIQGFYYSRPIPASDVAAFLHQHAAPQTPFPVVHEQPASS
jgi:diguanylate cyclase (GGDEF)-like protein/PAS domain S-box-containing protein